MKPEEIRPTVEQRDCVVARGYRQFLQTNDDGSQTLITVYRDTHTLEMATRPDRWSSWSAPIWLQEIWD